MRNNQSGDNSMAKVKKREEYGDDSIEMLKGADRVRKKPSVIFGSNGIEGCEHSVFEIISNSVDEAREGFGNTITVTRFEDKSIEVQDYGRGIPVEFNRRENEYNWKLLFCELYAGGKYNTSIRSAQTDSAFAPRSMPRSIWRRRFTRTAIAIICSSKTASRSAI